MKIFIMKWILKSHKFKQKKIIINFITYFILISDLIFRYIKK